MSEHASTDRLLALIREHALIEGGDFELASGARASVYIDLRRVTMHPEGADVIATCERGRPVTVCGTIRSVTLHPRVNVPTLEAEVYDGSGHMTLVWLGRRRLSGVDVGRSITAHGRVTCPHGSPMMFNPSYRLHPASVEAER